MRGGHVARDGVAERLLAAAGGVQSVEGCGVERDRLWGLGHGQPAALHHLQRRAVIAGLGLHFGGDGACTETLGLCGLGERPTVVLSKLRRRPPREGDDGVPKSPM